MVNQRAAIGGGGSDGLGLGTLVDVAPEVAVGRGVIFFDKLEAKYTVFLVEDFAGGGNGADEAAVFIL